MFKLYFLILSLAFLTAACAADTPPPATPVPVSTPVPVEETIYVLPEDVLQEWIGLIAGGVSEETARVWTEFMLSAREQEVQAGLDQVNAQLTDDSILLFDSLNQTIEPLLTRLAQTADLNQRYEELTQANAELAIQLAESVSTIQLFEQEILASLPGEVLSEPDYCGWLNANLITAIEIPGNYIGAVTAARIRLALNCV